MSYSTYSQDTSYHYIAGQDPLYVLETIGQTSSNTNPFKVCITLFLLKRFPK